MLRRAFALTCTLLIGGQGFVNTSGNRLPVTTYISLSRRCSAAARLKAEEQRESGRRGGGCRLGLGRRLRFICAEAE